MSAIRRYILVDRDDNESDFDFDNYQDALAAARAADSAVVAHIYEFNDSELVWTPTNDDRWPPTS